MRINPERHGPDLTHLSTRQDYQSKKKSTSWESFEFSLNCSEAMRSQPVHRLTDNTTKAQQRLKNPTKHCELPAGRSMVGCRTPGAVLCVEVLMASSSLQKDSCKSKLAALDCECE